MRASLTGLGGLLLIIAALSIGACGLKGDLYLPEDEAAATSPEVVPDTNDTDRAEDDENRGQSGSSPAN